MLPLMLLMTEVLASDCDRVLIGVDEYALRFPAVGDGVYRGDVPVSFLGALSLLMSLAPEQIREYHGACLQ